MAAVSLFWDTNMAAVSLFWDTNMAAIASCENTQYSRKLTLSVIIDKVIIFLIPRTSAKQRKSYLERKVALKDIAFRSLVNLINFRR